MLKLSGNIIGLSILAATLLSGPCFAGNVFTFDYSFPAEPDSIEFSVAGHGTLTTGDFNPVLGGYLVTGITGTRSLNGVDSTITGLIPVGMFGGNSNVVYFPGTPSLDNDGLSFTIDQAGLSNDLLGNVNVFFSFNAGSYTENSGFIGFGTFTLNQQVVGPPPNDPPGTPEPSTVALLVTGLAGLAFGAKRRSRRNQ
jgi:hypothetical protein